MREIKFRAWDEEAQEMLYSDKDYERCTFVCESEGTLKCYVPETVPQTHDEPEYIVGREIFQIMQFTGRKDKNGKEIYEGDKITSKLFDGIVTWMDFSFRVVDEVGFPHQLYNATDVEVIGTIHEGKA